VASQEPPRPDPDELLRRWQSETRRSARGRLKIFLGYASGVGKSFRMLDEGRRRRERGEDVVVAALQDEQVREVQALLPEMEVIPLVKSGGRAAIDRVAIQRRRPGVCLVDGLAYDNPPGWITSKRWQDVEWLLAEGMSVLTSLNVQHIEERADEAARIRGRRSASTVPEAFVQRADEIVIVDAPEEYCLARARQEGGAGPDAEALAQQLAQLREIALLLAADVVDRQLTDYLKDHGDTQPYATLERVLVCVTPKADGETMLRRGRRQADRFHGELHAVYVNQPNLSADDAARIDDYLRLARHLGAAVHALDADDPIGAIVQLALARGITQIFVGHSREVRRWPLFRANSLERLIHEAEGMDVRIFPN
jgi:two-component system, OmpR family, sensor histidine kinase KdpD